MRDSRRPSRLYMLLASTLMLAGVLGYQAYDAARSHRATAENALRQYSELAGWRYSEHAQLVLSNAIGSSIMRLGKSYHVPIPSLWEPSILWVEIQLPGCCATFPKPLYTFRASLSEKSVVTAGHAPAEELLFLIRDTVIANAQADYEIEEDKYRVVFAGTRIGWQAVVYAIRLNSKGEEFVYGMVLEPDVFGEILAKSPPEKHLLPPSLTAGKKNESLLGASVATPAGTATVVLGEKLPHTYAVKAALAPPFDDLVVEMAVKPEVAESLVIGGLPASRLPVVVGAFVLTAALILVAVRQLRRENELARQRANFAMGVSHELRTPLTQIRMFLESVLLGRTTSSEQSREYLEIAHEESKRLSNLVDNVLRFSRVERGSARVNPKRLDLAAETRRIAESYVPRSSGRSTEIRMELQDDIEVSADPEALRAILGNLLDNAVKYGPQRQIVTVGIERWNSRARLWVSDHGPGVPKEERDRVWEPYQRLDRDLEAAVAGTGIGLAIVREFVHLHRGEVWVEEAPGGGARFVVQLPLAGSDVSGINVSGVGVSTSV